MNQQVMSRLSPLWSGARNRVPRRLPSGQRALTLTGWGEGVGAAATAATGPLALQLRFFTDPVPDNWGWAAVLASVSAAFLIVMLGYHQWIQRNGRTLYYVTALDRAKRDDGEASVGRMTPRFLDHILQRWPLPSDPGGWQDAVDRLARHLDLLRATREGQGRDALVSNSEWPAMWYLGHELAWEPELWERGYTKPWRLPEPAIDLERLLAQAVPSRPDPRLLRIVSDEANAAAARAAETEPLVVLLETSRRITGIGDVLETAGPHRLVRLQSLNDAGKPTVDQEQPDIPRERFETLVTQLNAALARLFADVDRVILLATIPTSWPYALGALMRNHERLPRIRFAVFQGPGRFALTDLVIPGRDPRPTPQSF